MLYSGLYPYSRFPAPPDPAQKPTGGLHALTISNDGSRAYFALLTGGFAVADVSEFAAGKPGGAQPRPITDNAARPTWKRTGRPQCGQALEPRLGVGLRRGVRQRHRSRAMAVRGAGRGWSTSPIRQRRRCGPSPRAGERPVDVRRVEPAADVYSAHNPTLTPNVAFSTWNRAAFRRSASRSRAGRTSSPSSRRGRFPAWRSRIRGSRRIPTRGATRRS